MNAQQYANYEANVASFIKRNAVKPGCHGPTQDQAEPFFSWRHCECCGSGLGGNRETYSFAYDPNQLKGSIGRLDVGPHTFEADICTDCVYYLAYGQLDDMTMLDIEASKATLAQKGPL